MEDWAAYAGELDRSVACRVDRDETLRYLGYVNQDLSSSLRQLIDHAIARCDEVGQPAWAFRVFPVKREGDYAYLQGSALAVRVTGSLEPLSQMRACAIAACTIGLAFDREARRLAVDEATEALVFDAAGSSMVEACADACEAQVMHRAREQGLHAGQRMSPGYGDLPLGFSAEIVRALDAGKRLGLSVMDSGLLVPQKSVTALVGLFDREEDARRAHRSCSDCIVRQNCPYLEAGNPCNEK